MSSEKKMITLKSSDGETFEIEEAVTLQSDTIIKHMGRADNAIPLPEVDGATLGTVLEYCNRHVNKDKEADDLKAWDKDYVKVHPNLLFQLILAADYLKIKGLLDLTRKTMVDKINDYHPDRIHELFDH